MSTDFHLFPNILPMCEYKIVSNSRSPYFAIVYTIEGTCNNPFTFKIVVYCLSTHQKIALFDYTMTKTYYSKYEYFFCINEKHFFVLNDNRESKYLEQYGLVPTVPYWDFSMLDKFDMIRCYEMVALNRHLWFFGINKEHKYSMWKRSQYDDTFSYFLLTKLSKNKYEDFSLWNMYVNDQQNICFSKQRGCDTLHTYFNTKLNKLDVIKKTATPIDKFVYIRPLFGFEYFKLIVKPPCCLPYLMIGRMQLNNMFDKVQLMIICISLLVNKTVVLCAIDDIDFEVLPYIAHQMPEAKQ